MNKNIVKPIVVISNCLEFKACRYNGKLIPNSFIKRLEPFVIYKPICPEIEISLGVPRDPIKIMSKNNKQNLVQPSTGNDYTVVMNDFAKRYNDSLTEVDGFILKSRSPSCGIKDVKLYGKLDKGQRIGKTTGLFAKEVLKKFEGLAIEDEARLSNHRIREHFLTKLFLLASFRHLKKKQSIAGLIKFHSVNKFILMSHNQSKTRGLGNIIGSYNNNNLEDIFNNYEEKLKIVLNNIARKDSNINMFMHVFGFFSKYLNSNEKAFFLDNIEKYRNNKITILDLLLLLKSWILKYEQKYLMEQTFFSPYPEELINI
jgi:uncharacterized protein YbgA (DUF1722 family)/uncharacterized protein YbbK (DUF523 family)